MIKKMWEGKRIWGKKKPDTGELCYGSVGTRFQIFGLWIWGNGSFDNLKHLHAPVLITCEHES